MFNALLKHLAPQITTAVPGVLSAQSIARRYYVEKQVLGSSAHERAR
jgi:hypothetical protein